MAKRKAKKAPAPAKRQVTFEVFGNSTITVGLNAKNDTLGKFISQNVPKQWNMEAFGLYVNDKQVDMDYRLNNGDQISAAPNVAGGRGFRCACGNPHQG